MARVTIQYWAAAREAAGVELESVDAGTLAEALDAVVARRGENSPLRSVLARSSFLVDGAAAGRSVAADLVLPGRRRRRGAAAIRRRMTPGQGGSGGWVPPGAGAPGVAPRASTGHSGAYCGTLGG